MITNKDLEIENISYTNKDFGQIYPELLELVKKLTNKWDPEATNESDPGIVLLKLIAFLGDKLNYNIDKNTLEQFIVSATQEVSMRRLTEMLGYNMKYYRSATTRLSFRYLGELGKSEEEASDTDVLATKSRFYIKAFDTTFKTEDDIVYTLLEDFYVDASNKLSTGKLAIQGQLKQLNILGSDGYENNTLIQLYNLDHQNRLYFPDVEVAENGVYINKEIYDPIVNPDAWHRVDSLNDQDLGSRIFKFGFDSDKGFPYIEFPKDINDLIEDGLEVYYIVSSGENGKVVNNKLTKFDSIKITEDNTLDSPEILSSLDEDIYVLTNGSSTEAYNPETLTEAYDNFKKVVGTFNTLVSCRDYSNYINRYEDNEGNYLVSNVVATDVRTDPEYTKTTFIRDKSGASYYKSIITSAATALNYYNVILHGTYPVSQEIQTLNQYEKTYQPLNDSNIEDIRNALSEVKTINHNLTKPEPEKLNIIEADYTLKCNISTKYKVNSTEQKQIINNIKQALFLAFNARKVEFGEEIPYETIVEVLENADTRIKNISLDEPDINYYIVSSGLASGTSKVPFSPSTHIEIIIDNVRAGALPLYGEDTSFKYDYTMALNDSSFHKYPRLCALNCKLEVSEGRELKSNESVQLVEDSFITQISYPAYIYYAFYSNSYDVGEIAVKANTTYKLKENEYLYITYTDSSDVKRYIVYEEGQVFKANFDIVNTRGVAVITSVVAKVEKKSASKFVNWNERLERDDLTYRNYDSSVDPDVIPLFSIGTNEQIDMLKRHEIILPGNSNAFWYIKPKINSNTAQGQNPVENEQGDIIFKQYPYDNRRYYYILEEGELFIYPNTDMTSLNILGAGTKLEYSRPSISRLTSDIIDLNELETSIEDEDVGTFRKSFLWQTFDQPLTIVESVISTFIAGDVITSFNGVSNNRLTSDWKKLTKLKVNNEDVTISEETNPLIRSVLSIYSSSGQDQKIEADQQFTLYISDIDEETDQQSAVITSVVLSTGSYIQCYPDVDSYNDLTVLQDLRYNEIDGKLIPIKNSLGQYLHTFTLYSIINYNMLPQPVSYTGTVSNLILYLDSQNKHVVNSRDEYLVNHDDLVAFFTLAGVSNNKLTITSQIDDMYFNIFDTVTGDTKLLKSTGGTLEIDLTVFVSGGSSDVLYITKPKILKVYDYLTQAGIANSIIQSLNQIPNYDWIGNKNNSKIIDSYTPLYSFFNSNNIYNKFTLPKIDFDTSEFNIVGSSKI